MKALIFTDLHIHDYKQFNTDSSRLDTCLDALEAMCGFAGTNNIDTILFAGDLYDTQKALLTIVVNKTVERFVRIFEKYPNITFYAITGNHDQSSKSLLEAPAISALDHLCVIFPTRFKTLDNKIVGLKDGVILAGVPYFEYKEHFAKRLEEVVQGVANLKQECLESGTVPKAYLLVHQTAKGIGNDFIPYDTDPLDPIYEIFDHVYCGHIHGRKEITPKFTNAGSPIHRDAGDIGEKKGFYVRNLQKPENGHNFVYLRGFPEFVATDSTHATEISAAGNYAVVSIDEASPLFAAKANVEDFNTSLDNKDLLINYWKEVDGSNEELLKIGLSFIK